MSGQNGRGGEIRTHDLFHSKQAIVSLSRCSWLVALTFTRLALCVKRPVNASDIQQLCAIRHRKTFGNVWEPSPHLGKLCWTGIRAECLGKLWGTGLSHGGGNNAASSSCHCRASARNKALAPLLRVTARNRSGCRQPALTVAPFQACGSELKVRPHFLLAFGGQVGFRHRYDNVPSCLWSL
jgi:hypothetical protein